MMELEQISTGDLVCCDRLDSLSAKYPWFVVQNPADGNDVQILSTLHNPLFKYHCQIPELLGKRLRGCFYGWMIVSDNPPHDNIWSLWNPSITTSNVITLPPLILKDGDYQSIRHCCLSAPPDDPTSVLLLTRTNKPTFVFCQLSCKRNKKLRNKPRWTEMSYSHQLKRITMDGVLVHSLTCCNGKVYALNTDSCITKFVIQVEIVVKDREVVVKLLLFGACPYPPSIRCSEWVNFLKGSDTELYHIKVGFDTELKKAPADVYLYKLDTTRINWRELEGLKNWDISDIDLDETEQEDLIDLSITEGMWEEMQDLKDATFFVDLARDNFMFYNPAIAPEFGGYIHIRDKVEKLIHSYRVNHQTILTSPMPSSVLPTSHVSMLEYRLVDDHREVKCTTDCKQEDKIVVTSTADDDVGFSESRIHNIPFDVLEMIMKFCCCVEYMNFRATCKRCHLAAPLLKWRNEESLRRLRNYSLVSPWLMVVEKNQGIISVQDPVLGDNYYMKNSKVLIVEDTYYSRFGWLLFKTDYLLAVFFNPFTNDLLDLPKLPCSLDDLCFSAPPTCPDCMVVGFTFKKVVIHFVAREKTWQIFPLHDPHPRCICLPTFHGEDLFALCNNGKLIVFKDLGKEDFSWKIFEAEAPKSGSGSMAQYFLVKCDEHVLLVVVGEFGEAIEVYKPNDFTRQWEKINGIGKHMIYICDKTCLCIEAAIPEMENKIYLPRLCSTNKKIVFYSLETCTYHTFSGTSIQEELEDVLATTTYLSAKIWIEPTWSR